MSHQRHPQMKAVLEKLKEAGAAPEPSLENIAAMRAQYMRTREYWNAAPLAMDSVQDYTVEAPDGEITVRLYRPSGMPALPLLLYCHGGAYILGNLDSHDNICRQLAHRSGWAVLAVDYHLAPEAKFPTPLADVGATLSWVEARATDLGIDPNDLALGGDSAGASIMLGVALDLKQSRPGLVKQLLLIYGPYGLGYDSESSQLFGGPEYGLSTERRIFCRSCYFAREEDSQDPRYLQLDADVAGLPPTLLQAAGLDPLRDDSIAMYEKMRAAGVAADYKVYEGMHHGFFHYTRMCDLSKQALQDAADALRAIRDPSA
jgi:acetyl esterase